MTLKHMPIRWKITILTFGVVLFAILIGGIFVIGNTIEAKEESLGEHAMLTGRTVANLPEVKNNITEPEGWEVINPIVERIRTINNADYIVILDMNRIRYSHPVADQIGKVSSGKDEGPAFAEHTYTSKTKGELGTAIRSYVPIMNDEREQVGVAIVGNILPSVSEILLGIKNEILFVLFITALFGVTGSWLLARHLKEQTYRLEPYEIVQLLVERTATFQAMNEGIIAIDKEGRVSLINEKAKKILAIEGEQTGQPIDAVLRETNLLQVLREGETVFNEEMRIGDKLIMSTRVAIKVEDEIVGAVAAFQDRTEMTRLAEELTGVKAFVDALRVQAHEHLNKMHTIAGLIQLDQKQKALEFVFQASEKQEELSRFLVKNMKDYSIAGLLISKVSHGKELGIDVTIDEHSQLKDYPPLLDKNDFVLILGNLIENAFQSFHGIKRDEKWVYISIQQGDQVCTVTVEDNGKGISADQKVRIFEKGFSTKGKTGSGYGLFLVKKAAEKGRGEFEVISYEGEGTSIILTFPMTTEEDIK
ncbi:ATP-binding protein [Halobacillus massiliensis]|uniref:ATP-binding protein n=1 Tax=Halobacillus massiliensis TaxID=1926286 RepID=UPI0009E4F5F3|nr:sensor histidine kinase [Halobacillus massiliensis]